MHETPSYPYGSAWLIQPPYSQRVGEPKIEIYTLSNVMHMSLEPYIYVL